MVFISRVSAVQIRPLLQIKMSPVRGTFLFVWVAMRSRVANTVSAGSFGIKMPATSWWRTASVTKLKSACPAIALATADPLLQSKNPAHGGAFTW